MLFRSRLVHFAAPNSARPGDLVEVLIDAAEPHYLIGTGSAVTPTRGGDIYNQKASTVLGMPKLFNK